MQKALCVLGFSTRALARAAVDTGYSVQAIDYFQDQDLQEMCKSFRRWPADTAEIPALIEEDRATQLIVLAGGAEDLGAELGELWGATEGVGRNTNVPTVLAPSFRQLRLLRDPVNIAALTHETGLQFPLSKIGETWDAVGATYSKSTRESLARDAVFGVDYACRRASPNADCRSRWLRKPFHGAGGWKIREEDSASTQRTPRSEDSYLQQFVPGVTLGVTCLLLRNRKPVFLGATRSIEAVEWPGPAPFIYRGSWGPVSMNESQLRVILDFAAKVQSQTGLLGWLPMDLIESEDGRLWLLEINPRWTAGMEVLHDGGLNVLPFHVAACMEQEVEKPIVNEDLDGLRSDGSGVHRVRDSFAKAIVYAEQNIVLSTSQLERIHGLPRSQFADLPSEAVRIEAGQPILTVKCRLEAKSRDETQVELVKKLLRTRERVLDILSG
jgi:predicted ATP-grasp superfamily ATP-dependent carboligase